MVAGSNPARPTINQRRNEMSRLTSMIDRLYKLRLKIDDMKSKLSELETKYGTLEQEIIEQIRGEGLEPGTKLVGNQASTLFNRRVVYGIEDWNHLGKYILRNRALDLLQRRLNSTAVKERLDDGKKVPGIRKSVIYKLSKPKAKE